MVTAFQLLRERGAVLTQKYYSAYIDLPGISLIMYSPQVNWGKEADPSTNNFDYPPVQNSSPDKNPQRNNLWTEVYYDDKASTWMVSTITPADQGGDWVGTVSQDVAIDELLKRTVNKQMPGTYNFIVDEQGRLIAHPQHMSAIEAAGGNLQLDTLNDPVLAATAELLPQVGNTPQVLESPDRRAFLGLSRIQGPNWYLVTVFPETLLQARAYEAAKTIFIGSAIGLLLEIALLAWIIRQQVAKPLNRLTEAAEQVASGTLQVQLDTTPNHELGHLAHTFVTMAERVDERDRALLRRTQELEHEVSVRFQSEQRMAHMATHDALTGLANRAMLKDRMTQALASADRLQHAVAVLFIDLDHFKQINDTLGHNAGDEVLCQIGQRISQLLRKTDTLCRQGGDEFVLLLPDLNHTEDAARVADKVLHALATPINILDNSFTVTPSIGISLYPKDADNSEALLRNADIAMYRAKDNGRNAYQFYTADMGQRASEAMPLETALREALEQGHLELYFQPKFSVSKQRIVSAEALLRWNRPGYGQVSPASFIPVAESRTHLMRAIDSYVLRTACRHLSQWQQAGHAIPLAINLSANQFSRPELVKEVSELLETHGLSGAMIHLELTEGVLMNNDHQAAENMVGLRQLGIHISIDDFGTGYSSLSYLHRFPVDELKIDRSFVNQIGHGDQDTPLVRAIIDIARALKLDVVAEGVETAQQSDYLAQHGCDVQQGYHFFKPMPEADLLEKLQRR